MHFHWRGSEHYVEGHRFAAELHLVHQNKNDSNKFAVLGILFRVILKIRTSLKIINIFICVIINIF